MSSSISFTPPTLNSRLEKHTVAVGQELLEILALEGGQQARTSICTGHAIEVHSSMGEEDVQKRHTAFRIILRTLSIIPI